MCGRAVGYRVVDRVALVDFVVEMTTNPAPGVKLDPNILADTVPLRRVGTIKVGCYGKLMYMRTDWRKDMAGTTLFLASSAGAYVNGAVWLVDGGRIGTVPSAY